jgi:hypothetical protein
MRWSEVVETTLGVQAWDGDEAALVLDLAREVAHNTERRFAPLTAYALGLAVGAAASDGAPGSAGNLVSRKHRAAFLQGQVDALLAALAQHTDDGDA